MGFQKIIHFINKERKRLVQINYKIFILLSLLIVGSMFIEKIFPSFFSFYISESTILIPLIISGLIIYFTKNEITHFSKEIPLIQKILYISVFEIMFIFGIFSKLDIQSVIYKGVFISITSLLFLFFQIKLLLRKKESDQIIKWIGKFANKIFLLKFFTSLVAIILFFVLIKTTFDPFFSIHIILQDIWNWINTDIKTDLEMKEINS